MESVRQLLLAAERGSQDDLQLLLNYPNDISPDACTANGRTALMAAASHNHCRCAEVLMNKGASIDFADENCNTALHVAALNGNCAMINLLVRRGANINAVTRKAKTPFALACQGGAAEAARILACTGCSIPIGSSAMEEYRKQAKFMDRSARWLKTKQVLALLDNLEKIAPPDWADWFHHEWPAVLSELSAGQKIEKEQDAVVDRAVLRVAEAREAAFNMKAAAERMRKNREQREAEEAAAKAAAAEAAQRELEARDREEQLAAERAAEDARIQRDEAVRLANVRQLKEAELARVREFEAEASAARKAAMAEAFKTVDKDGSGQLDKEEVRSLVEMMGKSITEEELDATMAEIDVDGRWAPPLVNRLCHHGVRSSHRWRCAAVVKSTLKSLASTGRKR